MRILHVIPYMHPKYGGPPQALKSMVDIAIHGGHDVKVYSTSAGYVGSGEWGRVDHQFYQKDIYHLFRPSFPCSWFYSKDLLRQLLTNTSKIDLMHLHVPFTAPFHMAAKFAIRRGVPFIATLHGLLDRWSMNQKSWKKWPYYYSFEKQHLSSANALHVTSSLEELDVRRLCLDVPIKNIPLSVIGSNDLIKVYKDISTISLLFVGRLHPVKSIPVILKAIKILSKSDVNIILNLAGSGSIAYERFIRDQIRSYQIEDKVIIHGHVGLEKKQSLYKECNIFLMPSLHENFGLAAAEAMASGLPVILSDQVGLAPDVKKWGGGIVIPANDANALAQAIVRLSRDLERMGRAAKELIDTQFSHNIFSTDLLAMYHKALISKNRL